jgi:hypothetical protein
VFDRRNSRRYFRKVQRRTKVDSTSSSADWLQSVRLQCFSRGLINSTPIGGFQLAGEYRCENGGPAYFNPSQYFIASWPNRFEQNKKKRTFMLAGRQRRESGGRK